MIRFTLNALLGVPVWLLYFALMTPLILVGFPLVALLALHAQLRFKYRSHTDTGLRHFPTVFGLRLFWLWDNDEDGIDGDPLLDGVEGEPKNPQWFEDTAHWSTWRRIFVWSAWRNSVGNARRTRLFGMTAWPVDVVLYLPRKIDLPWPKEFVSTWPEYRKIGPYVARQGWRFELRFPWPHSQTCEAGQSCTLRRFFWIGWRIAQCDEVTRDVGFALQPWGKL